MKTMKTCKMGCGKMKAGGPVKKVKKMAKGGATDYNYGIPLNGAASYNDILTWKSFNDKIFNPASLLKPNPI